MMADLVGTGVILHFQKASLAAATAMSTSASVEQGCTAIIFAVAGLSTGTASAPSMLTQLPATKFCSVVVTARAPPQRGRLARTRPARRPDVRPCRKDRKS